MNSNHRSVLFVIPAPLHFAPGQRFRFEHYFQLLDKNGIDYRVLNFYSIRGWKRLYTRDHKLMKIWFVVKGLVRRFLTMFTLARYDFIYVYREATPVGPAFFEWFVSRVLRKKIIYDFDDAIWLPVTSEYNKGVRWLRNFSKVRRICRRSYKVSVGNEYLAAFARQYNRNVVIVPTVVNTRDSHNMQQEQDTQRPCIGWTGSFSTLHYLQIVLPVLQQLQQEIDFDFIVIADKDPQLPLKNYRFIKWNRETEAKDLLTFHIGIMPLYDDDISRGKCGFKAIQYMSLGIPAVVSPVGVNSTIVRDGMNGFLCSSSEEWYRQLRSLLTDTALRQRFGQAARQFIEDNYSVQATESLYLGLFN
jgi:glycosyltransferase involved in cell wall biosynthesis